MSADDREHLADQCEISFMRASGPGGQSVNTTDSAVRLLHRSTGIVVKCQEFRSQHRNRARALEILEKRLHKMAQRQKPRFATKPTRSSQKKRVEQKRQRSDIKKGRGRVTGDS